MWLTSDGVRLALNGYVDPIRDGQEPPVRRVHDQFIAKGASPLVEFAGDGAMTLTY